MFLFVLFFSSSFIFFMKNSWIGPLSASYSSLVLLITSYSWLISIGIVSIRVMAKSLIILLLLLRLILLLCRILLVLSSCLNLFLILTFLFFFQCLRCLVIRLLCLFLYFFFSNAIKSFISRLICSITHLFFNNFLWFLINDWILYSILLNILVFKILLLLLNLFLEALLIF